MSQFHNWATAAPGFSFGGYSPEGLEDGSPLVGSRDEAMVGCLQELEAVCTRCLQTLTAETVKGGKFSTIYFLGLH